MLGSFLMFLGYFSHLLGLGVYQSFGSAGIGSPYSSVFGRPIPAFFKNAAIGLLLQRFIKRREKNAAIGFPIPALSKNAGTGLSITAVLKNAGKKTLGQDHFFVVWVFN